MIRDNFYEKMSDILSRYGHGFLINIVEGIYEGIDLKSTKCIINDEITYFEENSLKDIWIELIKEIDFSKGTHTVYINGFKLFIEYLTDRPELVICGGGHIAVPISKIGKMLDFKVVVIDNRAEFANKERFNDVDDILCEEFEDALEKINANKNTYFVIVTRGHKDDRRCLEKVLRGKFMYVGMIGSKSKVGMVMNVLREEGFSEELLKKVHSPIGLKIGGQTPAEIAVSIAAEIVQAKNEKKISTIEDDVIQGLSYSKKNRVLATIVEKTGSTPRGESSRMLIYDDRTFIGTVGGGSIENAVYEKSLELIKEEKSYSEVYDLSNSAASKLGMACGGRVNILFEYIRGNK